MQRSFSSRLILTGVIVGMSGVAFAGGREDYFKPNYDKARIALYTLEDPLAFADGRRVTPETWSARRREILDVFAREMYGMEPPKPETVVIEKFDDAVTLGGFGIRRQYRMWFKADRTGPAVDWLVLLPRYLQRPAKPILFLNYGGNHELVRDPEVPLTKAWLAFRRDHRADEALRGRYENMNNVEFVFPAHMILARGYALVTACYGEVSPDADPGSKVDQAKFPYQGVFDLWPKRDPARDDNTTAIGAWAWALSRGLDLAERIPELDAAKAVATGYSRLGKTALLAAARDERFAVCVPNQTGGGGCPLAKRDYGENVATQMRMFPYWYCAAYGKYAKDPAGTLTFDQHLLLASIAPRALMVQGYDSPWFDTEGEYLACRAASPAWEMLGLPGLPDRPFPPDYDTSCVGRCLAYVRRTEGHGHAAHDWTWLMDFADASLKERTDSAAQELFNGRDLTGWYTWIRGRGRNADPKAVFTVKDGVLHVSGEEMGALVSEREYGDYELEVEYRFPGGVQFGGKRDKAPDSGVLFHSTGPDGGFHGIWMESLEANLILGATGDFWGVGAADKDTVALSAKVGNDLLGGKYRIHDPEGADVYTIVGNNRICRFDIARDWKDEIGVAPASNERPIGEWNHLRLVCDGDRVRVWFNGRLVNSGFGAKPTRGRLQLQSEGCAVEFRRVTLRPLR